MPQCTSLFIIQGETGPHSPGTLYKKLYGAEGIQGFEPVSFSGCGYDLSF